MKFNFVLLFSLLLSTFLVAQNQEEDRKAIDQVVAKLYKAISFTNGEGANDEVLKSIHYSEAIVGLVDTSRIRMFSEREFREKNSEAFNKNNVISFVEKELSHLTHVYGGVATRFSTYEFTVKLANRERTIRGINSMQLIKDPEKGWLIHSTIFSDNGSYPEVPKLYLKK